MSGIKISDLPAVPSSLLTDVFPADQGATTYKETLQQVLTLFQANGAALTKVNDTNVTLTLGGSPLTSLLNATSLTLGWTGTLAETRGGTAQSTYTLGDTLYSSAANTLSKLAGNTTAVKQYLSQTGTGAVSAAPAWSTISGGDVTGAALTKVDDTNVTLTLGGTPTTALLQATSITAGWTGQLGLTRGGTAASLTASTGGIVYSGASALAILSGTATASLPLLSGATAAPTWGSFALSLGGALTTAGALTTSGAFGVTFTFTNTTSVTFPTSGTLATTSQIPTGAALTKTDDTNVTLTLGGSPTTALINAASITAGWTGQLGLTRGGTAASLTASNGGLVYSTASALAILSGTATAGQIPRSGASDAPTWSTATYPATAGTSGNVLTSDGTNFLSSAPVAGVTVIAVTTYTTGTNSFTPNTNTLYAIIELTGGGGGGGGCASNNASCSGGGGAGGYARLTVSRATMIGAGTQAEVVIGPGGAGGTAGANPGTGGTASTVKANNGAGSTLMTANGGSGGTAGAGGATSDSAAGIAGGSASGGNVNITGGAGTGGFSASLANTFGMAGNGGNNPLGFGGAGGAFSSGSGHKAAIAASGYGAGGAGETALTTATAGLAGTAGICIITEYRSA